MIGKVLVSGFVLGGGELIGTMTMALFEDARYWLKEELEVDYSIVCKEVESFHRHF